MSFVVYRPFRPSFVNRVADNFIGTQWFDASLRRHTGQPAVNVQEKPEGFVVELAAPGLRKEDFSLQLEGQVLKVSVGQVAVEGQAGQPQAKYHRQEFAPAKFERFFTLPKSVDGDQVAAEYHDGILTISLPKRPEAQPKPAKQILIG
jgi:HSP20 family protein